MPNVFIIRTLADDPYVQAELKQGRLRQRWGNADADLHAEQEDWVYAQCRRDPFWNNVEYYTTKYNDLKALLEIAEGDLLLLPDLPAPSSFTVCRAAGGYRFARPEGYDGDDFYHLIPVDIQNARVYRPHDNAHCETVCAKLRAYRSPVNHVCDEPLSAIVRALLTEPVTREDPSLSSIADAVNTHCRQAETVLQQLRCAGSRTVEKTVKLLFETLGYAPVCPDPAEENGEEHTVLRFKNNSLSAFFEAAANSTEVASEVYVQTHHATGVDPRDTEKLSQLLIRSNQLSGATKLFISTADGFSGQCRRFARTNNVLLIDRFGFMKLICKYLA